MDAVELPLPAAVTVSKLMGSEGCGGVGVKMGEIEIRESDRVSMLVTPSTEAGSSFRSQREKTHMGKQKSNSNAKRGDKRNGKVIKGKYDSFLLKNGLASFSSTAGGNNNLGVYGSKSDIFDVTKHLGDLSLNELLDGTYKCPSFVKEKGKKAANLTENLLHSVTKACSVLQLRKPGQPQNCVEEENSYSRKVSSACLMSSGSSLASRTDGDKGDTNATDLSSCNKLYSPKEILERLELPPPKDLDSLLLDAAKPVLSSRNNTDPRTGKTVSHRTGLPPFPWSHTAGSHCKSYSDAGKLSSSRSTCQGRWVKVRNTLNYIGDKPGFVANLESITYNQSLVPSRGLTAGASEVENAQSNSLISCERGLSSSATCATSLAPSARHSPSLVAAAQTLCEIAARSSKQNPHGVMNWQKKPSQKVMKACTSRSNDKSEKIFAVPKSTMGLDKLVQIADGVLPSKKPRLSGNEKSDEFGHTNTAKKRPINWSTPRSSRTSPSKSLKDTIGETKHSNSNIVKKPYTMPPSTRVLDTAGNNSQQKLRKLMPTHWNSRPGSKLDC
ncbi:unnamed protein product [Ilex paraguariensis]|uniref:Uncharacterized protein n=1 Tax=Ilex paraguariensis TaxID=185542 RepID=A0ABC8SL62_9AQUA